MPAMESQHCYSARLMKPFARLLRTYPNVPPEVVSPIDDLDPEARIPIATVHELLRGAIVITGDEDLGLKAAETIEVGDYGALEYAASTAQTVGEALALIGRYMHLINDALSFSIRVEGERAIISLDNAMVMPRAAEDFEVAAFFAAFEARARGSMPSPLEVSFSHAAPSATTAYTRVFSERAIVRFGQGSCGFAFPREALREPLPTADPKLNAVVRGLADRLLLELPKAESFTSRVRVLLMDGLVNGRGSAAHVAQALHVSPNTLTRKLAHEGTSFKELSEEIRRNMAQRYLGETDLALSEIAFLLGFSQTAPFHRAFKRWTEQTPLEYRAARRGRANATLDRSP
jgi:AraC-like DNA-binding protein